VSPKVTKALRGLDRALKQARKVIEAEHGQALADALPVAMAAYRVPETDGRRLDAMADAMRLWITTGGVMVRS
jgi:hypothetical protein